MLLLTEDEATLLKTSLLPFTVEARVGDFLVEIHPGNAYRCDDLRKYQSFTEYRLLEITKKTKYSYYAREDGEGPTYRLIRIQNSATIIYADKMTGLQNLSLFLPAENLRLIQGPRPVRTPNILREIETKFCLSCKVPVQSYFFTKWTGHHDGYCRDCYESLPKAK